MKERGFFSIITCVYHGSENLQIKKNFFSFCLLCNLITFFGRLLFLTFTVLVTFRFFNQNPNFETFQKPENRFQGTGTRIFKRLWSPGIDSQELIPPAYLAWRPGTTTPITTRFLAPIDCSKIPAQYPPGCVLCSQGQYDNPIPTQFPSPP
jgi:hypothetical protein